MSNISEHSILCFTHVSTGHCPLRGSCKFIHDPRICSNIKTKVHGRDLKDKDNSFYWPKNTRISRSPNTRYEISSHENRNKSVKVLWDNFVDFISNIEN